MVRAGTIVLAATGVKGIGAARFAPYGNQNKKAVMSAKKFLASKMIFGLDTKKRYNEVVAWMEEYATSCKKTVLVGPDRYCGMEEWYMPVIECPQCNHKVPALNSKFCSGCGVKLKLSVTVQALANKAW